MDRFATHRSTATLAHEAQLCRMLAAQMSLEADAKALLRQAMQLEAAIAASADQAPPR